MLPKPAIKKKILTKEIKQTKKSVLPVNKVLSRELSHVILTEPKPKHKRQLSYIPTNNQSTSQKSGDKFEMSARKLVESSSKKISSKSKRVLKSPRNKKIESYLLYIDTQFELFGDQSKSKISQESTDVRRDIDTLEQKDEIIDLINSYKRDYYVSLSRASQYEKQHQSAQDRAANNIKNKWKIYRTRKLINKFVKINKIKQRPQNIPSNLSRLDQLTNVKSLLSIETIKSEDQVIGYSPIPQSVQILDQTKITDLTFDLPVIPCLQNLKLKQIESILIQQKLSLQQKYQTQVQEIQTKYKHKKLSRAQYQFQLVNLNKFIGLRYSQINQSILNVKKLTNQTDNLLHQLHSNNVFQNSPLHCNSQKQLNSSIISNEIKQIKTSQKKNKEDLERKADFILQGLIDQLVQQFSRQTQKYPYMQKIIVQCFADWKIGVDCNEEAIDLFCQNLIQYTLSRDTSAFQNLKVSLGCSPQQLLKLHHCSDFEPDKQEDVISDTIFKQFSKIMVFPLKSKNSPKQLSIVKLIQILNYYHNRVIFQALNQALDYERIYGIVGKPLPWKPQGNFKKFHLYQSLSSAVDKVMSYQQWRCGFHPQNFFCIRPGLTMRNLNMVRDSKLQRLSQVEQKELQPYWQSDQMEQTFLLLDLNHLVYDYLVLEIAIEIQLIIQTR